MGVLSAVEHIFNETVQHARARKQSSGKGKQSKSWSKREDRGKSEDSKDKFKGKSKGTKSSNQGAKGLHKEVLKTRNRRQARTFRNLHH